ncbi:hypothetical protein O7632_06930 [Solwaraspora sp. WMMD406]|uniref:hypothetical protein n=1 Tax=Solwaraspora sp. WMMD406 TaxID=3016095 RepID=UPI002417AA6D|nr:hypothetical protein [Solwaraspora sp. WMMD406]MDG4763842.1 hypothetical protein [Solwaraspora sp. WMMD406]
MHSGQLDGLVDRLVRQVAHWDETRWAVGGGQRSAFHTLVQRLADLGAVAEGQPSRPVPRLRATALPDQLRVVATDLILADPDPAALAAATAAVADLRTRI